ncbi:MAG: hypothetical protein WDN44_15760 [Sphingomonas sp.]
MRLAVINDDMPFLVDSISGAAAAYDIAIHRILHPVIAVERDEAGALASIGTGRRESMVYIEMDRADARERRALVAELERTLEQVRDAVEDWPALMASLAADAARIGTEGAALLRWFHDGAMTLLAHETWRTDGGVSNQLGLARYFPRRADPRRHLARGRGGMVPRRRGRAAAAQVELHLDRPPPRAARHHRAAGDPRRRSRPASRSTRACGPAPRCPRRPRKSRCFAHASPRSRASSASIPRDIPARRCRTRSPRCRTT